MVEPIMLITTRELQHGKDHSPYLLGNVDFFFNLNLVIVLFLCCRLVGARTTVMFLVSSSLKIYILRYLNFQLA